MANFDEQNEEARKLFALLEGKIFADYAAATAFATLPPR